MDGPNASGLVACVLLGMLFLGIPVYATTIYAEDFSSPAKLSNDGATAELGNGGSYALGTWIYATANMGIDDPARGAGDGSSPANAISSVGQARPQNGRGTNARALSIILDRWLFTGGVEYTVSFDVIGDASGGNAGRYWLALVSGHGADDGIAFDGTHNGWGSAAGYPKPFTASGSGNATVNYVKDSASNGVLIDGEDGSGTTNVTFTFIHDGVSDVALAVGTYNNIFAIDNVMISDPNDGNLLPVVSVGEWFGQYTEIEEGSTNSLAISASDPDGSVTNIQVFIDGTLIDENASGNDYTLSNAFVSVASGAHELVVRATDDRGGASQHSVAFYVYPAGGELTGQRPYTLGEANIKEYLRFIPDDYNSDTNRHWPLMLWLHGAGARGSDALGLLDKGGPPSRINNNSNPFIPQLNEFIVISPRVTTTWTWENAQAEVDALVDAHVARFRVDPGRLIITGQSMGGLGTYVNVKNNPDKYAAVVPLCGVTHDVVGIADQLAHLPFWIFHDLDDPTIPVKNSDDFVAALEEAEAPNYKYSRLEGSLPNAHSIWWSVYKQPELYDWMLEISWLRKFYPSTEPLEPLFEQDTDGDGMTAREEYYAGTSPVDASSVFKVFPPDRDGGGVELSWTSVPGKVYTVYSSTNLNAGWSALLPDDIPGDPSRTNSLIRAAGDSTVFFQVRTSR